jgi:hypothetical protein
MELKIIPKDALGAIAGRRTHYCFLPPRPSAPKRQDVRIPLRANFVFVFRNDVTFKIL